MIGKDVFILYDNYFQKLIHFFFCDAFDICCTTNIKAILYE